MISTNSRNRKKKRKSQSAKLGMVRCSFQIFFLFFVALVAAVPVPLETEAATDGNQYAEDKGAQRPVLSYILGTAGCLVILGMILFTWMK